MRLAKLHISGFKSFCDRAELGFDHGVTAIVGPNGCGKSNVVDAITWVLGEQSAKSLRGERMEDVIFNGSDARKPTAAAEVRLKLANVAQVAMSVPAAPPVDVLLDEQPLVTRDVEIGRRLYRSGESEYLIDGQVCRLRDVHDLLMDSGLGVKAYAVIEQGKIGQILSSRPAERRMLIEEAAGVTKYKSRRRAAELKLEAAQQNLTRIDDIVFEVEKQRGALKRQAARARRYKRLREELRRWEQVQFAHRHETLSREIETADARLQETRDREAAAAAHVASLDAALERVRLGVTEAEAGANASREQAHARQLDIGKRQQQIQFDQQQIEELGRQAETFAIEVGELDARREPARVAIDGQRQAAADASAALADVERRVESCEAEYTRALTAVQSVERQSDTTRAAVMASSTTLSVLRQARDHAAAARDRVAADLERLALEARELAAEAGRARDGHAAATRALADANDAHAALVSRRTRAEADLAASRTERDRLSPMVSERQRQLAAREARLHSLEELDARRATFGDAARVLLAEAGDAIQQRGAVADHLIVDRSYERAVDALLGDTLQHVLVETTADLEAGLELLAGRDAGRGGFVVLRSAMSAAAVPEPPLVVPPGARAMADVVRATGPHAAVISRLIGRALIVDTFDAARVLAAEVSVPVATRTGEVFNGDWLVHGGSRRDVRGILETRAEVQALRDEVAAGHVEVDRLAAELSALESSIVAAENAVASLLTDQHSQEKAIVGHQAEERRFSDDLNRLTRRLELVETEHARAAEEAGAAEQRREEAGSAIDLQESQQRTAEAQLDDVLASLQASRDEAESRLRRVTEARTTQAALIERRAALDTEVLRLEEAARDLDQRIDARRADIDRTHTRREELRLSIRETERRLDEDIAALERLQQDMRGLDERVAALRAEFTAADHDIRAARHDLEGVRRAVTQAEVAKATAAADLTHLSSACVETIGASIEEVVEAVALMDQRGELVAPARRVAAASAAEADEEDETTAGEAIGAAADEGDASAAIESLESERDAWTPDEVMALLRKRIERLGPVNMMAIEQFDELETRHAFLTTQRKDLLDSIAQTGEAIRRIDKTTRERFAEAFESINEKFQKTFATLFGGGRAGLILIDQENDPESGIDIIAQPPGKRLQNVQLLSGGEKALTAMALMFAIFKHRPSPFCLLDEIDAPLDDANIGRFVEMLQGMQEHTQFILITHNRKTMEIADRLYGVTMEEPGVSKLISVQLN